MFIDAANMFYSQRTLGWRIDYERFITYLEEESLLAGVHYYTGIVGLHEKQQRFIKKLKSAGYAVTQIAIEKIKEPDEPALEV